MLSHKGKSFLSPRKDVEEEVCDKVLTEARELGDSGFSFEEDELEELHIEHVHWPFECKLSDYCSYRKPEEDMEMVFRISEPIYHPDDNIWVGYNSSTHECVACNLG